jgi:phosphinothricin acetyltransferase
MNDDKIRFAVRDDAARMLEIYAPNVIETPISFETEVPSLQEFQNRVEETLLKFPWLVYESNRGILGYAYAGPHRSRCAYGWSVESTVYVARDAQGLGIGKRLYQALFELLKLQGVVNVLAGIAQPNAPSVRLHESLGFVKVAHFKDIGFKLEKWWDVGWWQLQLQRPERPTDLKSPFKQFEGHQ